MENPQKAIDKLQQEIDHERAAVEGAVRKSTTSNLASKTSSSGIVLTLAGGLVVLGLSFTYAQMLGRQAVTRLTAGSFGGAAGLLVGFAIGRQEKSRRK
ncbi:hypothetical protein SynPROS71_01905 [Synechococcus sp. PROS-7-1]|nr:hypothetical protein SynPROS71_01905 [Synechococcus sp. PROS-7-1]